jgi:hypothetical protein
MAGANTNNPPGGVTTPAGFGPDSFSAPPLNGASGISIPVSSLSAHKTLVTVGIMVALSVVATEVAGTNHNAAVVIMLLLVGVLLIRGMTQSAALQNFTSSYPFNPGSAPTFDPFVLD